MIYKPFSSSRTYHFTAPCVLFGEDKYDLCYQYVSIHPQLKKSIKSKGLTFKIVESHESIK